MIEEIVLWIALLLVVLGTCSLIEGYLNHGKPHS